MSGAPPARAGGNDVAPRAGPDWRFIRGEVGRVVVLLVALIPPIYAWVINPPIAILFAFPVVASFFFDRKDFPVWALQSACFLAFMIARAFADNVGFVWRGRYAVVSARLIGFGQIPTAFLQARLRADWLDLLASGTYISYFIVPLLVMMALWISRRGLRRFVVASIVVYAASIAVHVFVPTIPPWMAAARGMIPPIRRIFMDVLWPAAPQIMDAGYTASANDVAAMPSVHLAITALAALGLGRFGRGWSVVGWSYAALMLFSIVYLGEHWVIDGIAGLIVAVFAWRVAPRVAPRIFPRVRSGTAAG